MRLQAKDVKVTKTPVKRMKKNESNLQVQDQNSSKKKIVLILLLLMRLSLSFVRFMW
jgi:hypothetical protein